HLACVLTFPDVAKRPDDIARLEDSRRDDAAVGCAAEAVIAQVVRQDVISGVVQNLVIGDELDLEAVAARIPYRVPRLEVSGDSRAAERHRVIRDDDPMRPG